MFVFFRINNNYNFCGYELEIFVALVIYDEK